MTIIRNIAIIVQITITINRTSPIMCRITSTIIDNRIIAITCNDTIVC